MKNSNHLPSGKIGLTIESEAYLELAKDSLLKYQYEDVRQELEAKSGQTDALIQLGTMHLHGVGAIPSDQQKAFQYFSQAALADNSRGWE